MRYYSSPSLTTVLVCAALIAAPCEALAQTDPAYDQAIPDSVRGPFVSNPEVVLQLDCPTSECRGTFSFARLMEARIPATEKAKHSGNPLRSSIGRPILDTIVRDLEKVRESGKAVNQQLNEKFLIDENSRIELVGIVNRMDRQFVKDPSVGISKLQQGCGEISVIYRVAYTIREGKQQSRLPVTLNLVFPALPFNDQKGKITCQGIANRWLAETRRPAGRSTSQQIADLLDPDNGPLATLDGRDLLRVELNMQEYRIKAGNDHTDFGTEAAYLLRVFRWNPDPKHRRFEPSYLRNQIDRDKMLNDPDMRRALLAFLAQKDTIASLDAGTLEIPFELGGFYPLATQAVSISPGGMHRSGNQPFWNAKKADGQAIPDQQIISDAEINKILQKAHDTKTPLSFIKTVDDFRARLNEQSCSGCHQTRAIAGFHFPGADRKGTPLPNAVLLPGSPQFYGDQPRRMQILELMASRSNAKLTEYELASSYADRPQNKFAQQLKDTQLIGGWGGACLIDGFDSQRQWSCKSNLQCVQLFESSNKGLGTCVPPVDKIQVGDPLQRGKVKTTSFGQDKYARVPSLADPDDPRIKVLPPNAPPGNSYYGAHQEYYEGDNSSKDRDVKRDAKTGGFPAGMLRLSECIGLPAEASCGGIASTGFNDCIDRLKSDQDLAIKDCFDTFTSYAGIRACDAASPCRDDYICVKPMGYTPDNALDRYKARRTFLLHSKLFAEINGDKYNPASYYGQEPPDASWIARNDQRGLCIPPYFVFQFRSDGHPAP